jgi:hypothetical protein
LISPGPATYTVSKFRRGPIFTIASIKSKKNINKESSLTSLNVPGPGTYNIAPSKGNMNKSYTIGEKFKASSNFIT